MATVVAYAKRSTTTPSAYRLVASGLEFTPTFGDATTLNTFFGSTWQEVRQLAVAWLQTQREHDPDAYWSEIRLPDVVTAVAQPPSAGAPGGGYHALPGTPYASDPAPPTPAPTPGSGTETDPNRYPAPGGGTATMNPLLLMMLFGGAGYAIRRYLPFLGQDMLTTLGLGGTDPMTLMMMSGGMGRGMGGMLPLLLMQQGGASALTSNPLLMMMMLQGGGRRRYYRPGRRSYYRRRRFR